MRKLSTFTFITINGYFKGPNEDISWHKHGGEESEYSAESLKSENVLLFGRVTYEMMASFWPTPMGRQTDSATAEGMNKAEKIVFSKTLQKAEWNNTRIVKKNIVKEVIKLKNTLEKDMTILGSGSIVTQFAEHGLIDEYQIMVDPVVIGKGTSIFDNIKHVLNLKLVNAMAFKSGIVLLRYQPVTESGNHI
jgi:dihydrofolate reductase